MDVTDPTNPHVRSWVALDNSTHTVVCVDEWNCEFAYSAGNNGKFSVIDLRDLDAPAVAGTHNSSAAGPNATFTRGAGHQWKFDWTGPAWHAGSGGTAVLDVRDPLTPVPVNATDENGIARAGTTSSTTTHCGPTPLTSERGPRQA